jgi:hypothetical protein
MCSMVHSFCLEANSHSTGQEIRRLLLNLEVHYHVHKSPPLDPILNQLNSVQSFALDFLKIDFNIVFPQIPECLEW